MGGEVDHVMKIEAKETETTARPIAAYGPPRIDSGPDRVYLTPVAGYPRSRFLQRRKVFRPSELSRGARESMQLSDIQRIAVIRSEEHTSELQSLTNLVCRLLLEKKK